MKIIIELRDKDIDNKKISNDFIVEKITNFSKKFWNCESIEVVEDE